LDRWPDAGGISASTRRGILSGADRCSARLWIEDSIPTCGKSPEPCIGLLAADRVQITEKIYVEGFKWQIGAKKAGFPIGPPSK
jgi:hypothetical protein